MPIKRLARAVKKIIFPNRSKKLNFFCHGAQKVRFVRVHPEDAPMTRKDHVCETIKT